MPKLCDAPSCTGCGACRAICPKNAIAMAPDQEGFLHPTVDAKKCVNCGLCEKRCPILQENSGKTAPVAFAAHSLDADTVAQSSSGGIFSLLSRQTIAAGGVVFGAAFDESWNVRHMAAEDEASLSALRGSKYVQSDLGDTFRQTEQALKAGRPVLFSGTPCQIGGLKSYLGTERDGLLCVDTICHSVPSPKAWQAFLWEQTGGEKAVSVCFRDKRESWQRYQMRIRTENGREVALYVGENIYMTAFLKGMSTRPSCAQCRFKEHRASDITLGDFWGVGKTYPEQLWEMGTSLVLVHSEKGRKALKVLEDQAVFSPVDPDKALENNPAYFRSSVPHEKRKFFWRKLKTGSFSRAVARCQAPGMAQRLRSLAGRALRR